MAILTVGRDQQYASLKDAVAASHDGDTLFVQAGTYVNDFAAINTKINIIGVGGMAHFVATTAPSNGKAILVTTTDVTIDHLEFSGAAVGDGNGGGIRYEGGNLTVTNSYFHDNQDGILAAATPGGVITIDRTEFDHNGAGDGQSHNVYVGQIALFQMTNSFSHDAVVGHEVKSRAVETILTNNRIYDNDGSASYSIDLPNGGLATIQNNVIQQGPWTQNPAIIAYAKENAPYAKSKLIVSGNTIINDKSGSSIYSVNNGSTLSAQITDNHFYGLTAAQITNKTSVQSNNNSLSSHPVLDSSHPWDASAWTALVSGGAGADLLSGSAGNDLFVGGTGADTFKAGAGADTILNFSVAEGDKIDLSGVAGYSDLAGLLLHATQTLSDGAIDLGNGNSLVLKNVTIASLTESAFLFSTSPDSAPVDIGLSSTSILENTPSGTAVGVLSAIDPDANDSLSFSMVDDAGGLFAIDGGNLVATTPFDYEAGNAYDIVIRVTDSAGQTYDKKLTIAVDNVSGETIDGSSGNDVIDNSAVVTPTGEEDSISGGAGQDSIAAHGGNDTLNGGAGTDTLAGGGGNDLYMVDSVGDRLIEGADQGADLALASVSYTLPSNVENLTLTGIVALAGAGNDSANLITGNSGANTLAGLGEADTLDGGNGIDTVTYAASAAGVDVSLYTGTGIGGHAEGDVLKRIENLIGSSFNDTLSGSSAANSLSGGDGSDYIRGSSGADTIDGGKGVDTLAGGVGNDLFLVNDPSDSVVENNGGGTDLVKASSASFLLPAFVENLTFAGTGNFTGTGNTLANAITGGSGSDTLSGLTGNDGLIGAGGNDSLSGGDGNDTLTGGAGIDKLSGGIGADRFVFKLLADSPTLGSHDTIADFNHSEADQIYLAKIDASTTVSGDQAFTFIGTQAFHHVAGELQYAAAAGGIIVSGDVNGDGVADFSIDVTGVSSLVAADFIL